MNAGTNTEIAHPTRAATASAKDTSGSKLQAASGQVVYEQPVNERTRIFLRLEYLFRQAGHHLRAGSEWDSRATLNCVLEIIDIFGNTNLKSEVIKELERITASLRRLDRNPEVDSQQLGNVLDEIGMHITDIHQLNGQIAAELKVSEFLTSIRQRSAIPGGTCDFDLPAFHFWLQLPAAARQQDLLHWLGHFDAVGRAIRLILKLIRNSTPLEAAVATDGVYQRTLDPALPYQMIRIALPANSSCYAELSGGRHRFTVRFLEFTSTGERARQTNRDVAFEMACCVI